MSLIGLFGCGESATITYKVIDEQGLPIADASVHAGYLTGGGWSGQPERNHSKQGKTNTEGLFVYKARVKSEVGAKVSKEGFYDTHPKTVKIWELDAYKSRNNPLLVVLKKKGNPVAMYAKHANPKFPISRGKVGYDLVVGDFVAPYGRGEIKDFIFHISGSKIDITFSGKRDGIQPFFVQNRYAPEYDLKSDRLAPTTGYFVSLKEADNGCQEKYQSMKEKAWKENISFLGEREWSEEVNYYFRVRSQDGKQMYGKVYGFFRVLTYGNDTEPHVEFTYYLNPDGTNNVEFAPGKSYFPSSSQVGSENPPGVP